MKLFSCFVSAGILALTLFGCREEAPASDLTIKEWEERYATQPDVANADSLTRVYLAAVALDSSATDQAADFLLRAARAQRATGRTAAAEALLFRALRGFPEAAAQPDLIRELDALYTEDLAADNARLTLLQLQPAALNADQRQVDTATFHRRMATLLTTMGQQTTTRLDAAQADEYIRASHLFALLRPTDSLSAPYLFKAAEIAAAIGQPTRAIDLYNWIARQFPDHPRAGTSLFMQAFLLDEDLKNLEAARRAYTHFLERYPQHELADDAQLLLDNLGKSDADILRELENQ